MNEFFLHIHKAILQLLMKSADTLEPTENFHVEDYIKILNKLI